MLIDRKTDYGLRCLAYLAGQAEGAVVTTDELSKKLRVSRSFISKIFQLLARQGILIGNKGKKGGYQLKSKKVSLARIISIIDPDLSLNKCLNGKYHCFMEKSCPLHKILEEMQRAIFKRLAEINLGAL